MKRREFIQTVAALGAGAALPGIDVLAAPPAPVATAVAAAVTPAAPAKATLTFFVDALGNLSFGNEPSWPKTRAEALGLCPVFDRSGLEALMQEGNLVRAIRQPPARYSATGGSIRPSPVARVDT